MKLLYRWLLFVAACILLGVGVVLLCIFLNDSPSVRVKSKTAGIANSESAPETQIATSPMMEPAVLPKHTYKAPIFIQEPPPWDGYDRVHIMQSRSLAMSSDGKTLAIGAPYAPCVYVQTKRTGKWMHETVLYEESRSLSWFGLGISLSADGNTLACGALNMSKVWIYTRADSIWTTQAELSGPAGSGYGVSTALSYDGNTLAIGSNNIPQPYQPGLQPHVYIFTRNGVEWTLQQTLNPTDSIGYSNFGYSIALSGDGCTVVAGGYTDRANTGAIWVSQRAPMTDSWSTPLKIVVEVSPSKNQGRRVAVSGDGSTIAFTEIDHDLEFWAGDFRSKWMTTGRTYVFINTGKNTWRILSNLTPHVASAGASVCLNHNGERLFIGDTASGCVYVFSKTGRTFYKQESTITLENPTIYEQLTFGASLAIDAWGETLAIGVPYERGPEDIFGMPNETFGEPIVGATFVYET